MSQKKKTPSQVANLDERDAEVVSAEGSPAGSHAADLVNHLPATFPVVGIGASAGGLAAFEAFFAGMPTDTDPGMAFVLVQHLAPNHKSILSDLVRRYTRMQVFDVEDGMTVRPNCAYIIPPGHDMAFLNGRLQLLPPSEPRGIRLPIDFFFRSLAHDQRERAIGIVLSGTGSDGTLGVRAIKGEGGMAMAQNPSSTEFDGMPRSAIATGMVDYELPPAEMPSQLIAYATHAFGKIPRPAAIPTSSGENSVKKIFVLLRAQTGHDFSHYKPNTIHRRIERRMAVHQIDALDSYVKFLQQTPVEIDALFRDLLIGVTSFFRDPEAFQLLEEQIIPKLFDGKPTGAVIRVWTAGCSTGEEAYSIAILLMERIEVLKQSYAVQLFATDIDSQAIATARAGLYPASIAADLSPERLARFFTVESGGGYRVHKSIRDLLIFSEQDVIKDPPFSKLDLLSCRNLLIYMGTELQKKLIPLFHYALKPNGVLFLGTSEGIGEFGDLYTVLDRKAKMYQRKEDNHGMPRAVMGQFLPPLTAMDAALASGGGKQTIQRKPSLRELTERALLQQADPAGALINRHGDILYLHGRTGMFLEPAPGDATINNILKMARDGLRRPLTTSLHRAVATNDIVYAPKLHVKTNGHFTTVNLTIRPVTTGAPASPESPLYLVILEEKPDASPTPPPPHAASTSAGAHGPMTPDAEDQIAALRQELRAKEEYLQSTNEELESSTEELKSSNEEMQSVNEELQSSNEELETSKEELQSVNEELATVNTELQTKVADLSRANNDMNNLLAGTGIGTVFVDHQLHILRFTPAASTIINLILSDVGRPLTHIVTNLVGYTTLVADIQTVLDKLVPKEVVVRTKDDKSYTMRIQPYRTLNNVIEGAVISFVDITEILRTRDELARTSELLERTGEMANVGGWMLDLRTMKQTWSLQMFRILEISPPVEPATLEPLINFYDQVARPVLQAAVQAAVQSGTPYDLELPAITVPGRHIWLRTKGIVLMADGKAIKLFGTCQDVTLRKVTDDARHQINDVTRLAAVVRDAHDAITVQDPDGRILAWNPGAARLYGWSEDEALRMNTRDRIPQELREEALIAITRLSQAEILQPLRTQRLTKRGLTVDVSVISTALLNAAGQMYAVATTERLVKKGEA